MKACEKRRASFRRSHKMKSDREPSPEAPVGAAGNAGYSGDHPGETSDDDEAKLDKLCLYVFIMISRNSYYGLTKRFRKTFHKIRLVFELKNYFLVIPHSRRPRTTATAWRACRRMRCQREDTRDSTATRSWKARQRSKCCFVRKHFMWEAHPVSGAKLLGRNFHPSEMHGLLRAQRQEFCHRPLLVAVLFWSWSGLEVFTRKIFFDGNAAGLEPLFELLMSLKLLPLVEGVLAICQTRGHALGSSDSSSCVGLRCKAPKLGVGWGTGEEMVTSWSEKKPWKQFDHFVILVLLFEGFKVNVSSYSLSIWIERLFLEWWFQVAIFWLVWHPQKKAPTNQTNM